MGTVATESLAEVGRSHHVLLCTAVLPYLVVLDFASHHAEGIVSCVVVDVDSAETGGASSWDPLPVSIIVHHDSSPGLADALFTEDTGRASGPRYRDTNIHTHTNADTQTLAPLTRPSPSLVLLRFSFQDLFWATLVSLSFPLSGFLRSLSLRSALVPATGSCHWL